jgi:hypothetical protein
LKKKKKKKKKLIDIHPGKKRTSLYSAEILATTTTYIRIRFDADNIGPREYSVTPKSCYHVPTRRSPKWSPSKDDVVLVHVAPTVDRAAAPPVAAHMDPAEKDLLFETVAFCAVARIHEVGVPGSVSVTWLDVNRASPARVKLDDVVPVSVRFFVGRLDRTCMTFSFFPS